MSPAIEETAKAIKHPVVMIIIVIVLASLLFGASGNLKTLYASLTGQLPSADAVIVEFAALPDTEDAGKLRIYYDLIRTPGLAEIRVTRAHSPTGGRPVQWKLVEEASVTEEDLFADAKILRCEETEGCEAMFSIDTTYTTDGSTVGPLGLHYFNLELLDKDGRVIDSKDAHVGFYDNNYLESFSGEPCPGCNVTLCKAEQVQRIGTCTIKSQPLIEEVCTPYPGVDSTCYCASREIVGCNPSTIDEIHLTMTRVDLFSRLCTRGDIQTEADYSKIDSNELQMHADDTARWGTSCGLRTRRYFDQNNWHPIGPIDQIERIHTYLGDSVQFER